MPQIWKQPINIEQLNEFCKKTLVEHLAITITEIGDDYLKATMPVDERTKQPLGILHGGANCVLAETVGSIAGNFVVDENHYAVGLNITTHHLKSVRRGIITGVARPIHLGRTIQLWKIETFNEQGQVTSSTQLEMMVREK